MRISKRCHGESIKSEINKWYKNKEKFLNIVLEPYSSLNIIEPLIEEVLRNTKKVLYFTKDKIKEVSRSGEKAYNGYGFREIYDRDREEYELLIYDDITSYSEKSKLECLNELGFLFKKAKKTIIFSMEEISENIPVLEVYNSVQKGHFIEPRVIKTKMDLRENMPYMLYEYIMWFKEKNRVVIIYTPTKEKGKDLCEYYETKLKIKEPIKYIQYIDEKILNYGSSYKKKSMIIITNNLQQYFDKIKDVDLIFYFSDDKFFDYKKILFACGALKREENYNSELLLICNEETSNIEKAKYISRGFNKLVWES